MLATVRERRFGIPRLRFADALTTLVASGAAAALTVTTDGAGDYQNFIGLSVSDNAAPATNALAAGRLHDFFALHPYMGSFSLLVRAPFVALGHALRLDDLSIYRVGTLVCLIPVVLIAIWFARLMAERGQPLVWRLVVVALMILNPMSFNGILLGHPEELLAAALCLGAVIAACDRRPVAAGVMLGIAVATKQWAIVATLPVILAAPQRRLRLGLAAAAAALVLTLPLAIGDTSRFVAIAHEASQTLRAPPTSLWAPFAQGHQQIYVSGTVWIMTSYSIPPSLGSLPRPLILLTTALLALAYARRRGSSDILGLLALCLLVRGMLDPISPGYYYAPFLLALGAWEGLRRKGPPLITVTAAAALWFFFGLARSVHALANDRPLVTELYLAWALVFTVMLVWRVYAVRGMATRDGVAVATAS